MATVVSGGEGKMDGFVEGVGETVTTSLAFTPPLNHQMISRALSKLKAPTSQKNIVRSDISQNYSE